VRPLTCLFTSVQLRAVHPDLNFLASVNFLTLQPLTPPLLPAVVDLDRRCLGGLWTLDGYQRELDSPSSDLLVLINLASPTIPIGLGCLWAIAEEAHITLLAVDPNYRRQGLGQLMLYALLLSAWQRKLEWATLEVRISNQAAIQLYEKFGFERVGERRRYYQDTGENALILWRKGLQRPEFLTDLQQWQQALAAQLAKTGWSLSQLSHPNWHPSHLVNSTPIPLT